MKPLTGKRMTCLTGRKNLFRQYAPQLFLQLDIDPADDESQNDKFILKSTDEMQSYQQILTVEDDAVQGNDMTELIFKDLDKNLNYTLEIQPGDDEEPYFLFEDVPFTELDSLSKTMGREEEVPEETPEPEEPTEEPSAANDGTSDGNEIVYEDEAWESSTDSGADEDENEDDGEPEPDSAEEQVGEDVIDPFAS